MSYEMPDTIIETIRLVDANITSTGFEVAVTPPGRAYYLAKAYATWRVNGGASSTLTLKKITDSSAPNAADSGTTVVTLTSALAVSSGQRVPTAFTFLTTAAVAKARRFKPLTRLVGVSAGTVSPLADVQIMLKWVATR